MSMSKPEPDDRSIDAAGKAGKALVTAYASLRQAAAALGDVEAACDDHDPHCDCPACDLLRAGEFPGWRWAIGLVAGSLESLARPAVLRAATPMMGDRAPAMPLPALELEPVPQGWRPR